VGKRIVAGATSRFEKGKTGPHYREIVGVVGNVRQSPFSRDPEAIYYTPYRQMPWQAPTLLVRTTAGSTPNDVRRAVARLDPNVPVDVRTMQSVFDVTLTAPRLATWLMGSFAAIGLLLTATGLYGLLSYAVLRRTRELGVRLALGASRGRIVGHVLTRALVLVSAGIGLGSLGAVAVTALLRNVVFVPAASGPLPFLGVVGVILLTAAVAAALPARRAASIDPTRALRAE
jgi:putative ABC transport system permease protein